MIKLNSIFIEGLRGVRNEIELSLNAKSALIYGDNGSGKSTFADVLEWFFYDKVVHLSGEEIDTRGYGAMRNIFLADTEEAKANFKFTNSNYDTQKNIVLKNEKLKTHISNDNHDFQEYLKASGQEKFILRYKDLVKFVLFTKKDKLDALSNIIGYSKLTDTRSVLKSMFTLLSREIRSKDFEGQIGYQQSQIIEQFGQNITSDEQFINVVNKLIEPFNLDIKASTLQDINLTQEKIKKPDDSKELSQEKFLIALDEKLVSLPAHLDELEIQYKDYKIQFDSICADIGKLKKLALDKLITSGISILEDDGYDTDDCPLCLIEKNKKELLASLYIRTRELEAVKLEQIKLVKTKEDINKQIIDTTQIFITILNDPQINELQNTELKNEIEDLSVQLKKYGNALKNKPDHSIKLDKEDDLLVDRSKIASIQVKCKAQIKDIQSARKDDPKWDVYTKINIARHAYVSITKFKEEQKRYETQRNSLDLIYSEFLKCQKESLEAFLNFFSGRINEIYQFLNPDEKVENIKLIPLEKDDELQGITIQLDFLDNKDVSPPQKFLSESHLNCVGIAFFLSSMEAFNKRNKFMVLDDVISSFDEHHRKRFADLLIEEYKDYQIILLTHEKAWFEIVKNLVQGKSWSIQTIKHNESNGSYFDETPQTLRERIERKITNQEEDNLGKDARVYLEGILKDIACNTGVKVDFRFNDKNEDRMASELLTSLIGTLKKRKCTELKNLPILNRLKSSTFIANKDSHDSKYIPTFSDKEAFWKDVCDLEKLFYCDKCNSCISMKHYDTVEKKLRCKDGKLFYSWDK